MKPFAELLVFAAEPNWVGPRPPVSFETERVMATMIWWRLASEVWASSDYQRATANFYGRCLERRGVVFG